MCEARDVATYRDKNDTVTVLDCELNTATLENSS